MSKIHWINQVSADFNTAGDWSGGAVPGASDDAILNASGTTPYTATASTSETVRSIQLNKTATLSIANGNFTATKGTGSGANAGVIAIGGHGNLTVGGVMDNAGSISISSAFQTSGNLIVATSGVTLTGGGTVSLAPQSGRYYGTAVISGAAAGATLTNFDNTISGAGNIGNNGSGNLTLVNDAAGVIDATGGLVLNTGTQSVTNAGLLEATGGGVLSIYGAVNNSTGTLSAGAGSMINLQSADIVGGDLQGSGEFIQHGNNRGSLLDGRASAIMTRARWRSSATSMAAMRS